MTNFTMAEGCTSIHFIEPSFSRAIIFLDWLGLEFLCRHHKRRKTSKNGHNDRGKLVCRQHKKLKHLILDYS